MDEKSRDRLKEQRIELAQTIANQAQAIADGTVTGPEYSAVRLLVGNAETLLAWTAIEETGKGDQYPCRSGQCLLPGPHTHSNPT
jgi:hypothetical protein